MALAAQAQHAENVSTLLTAQEQLKTASPISALFDRSKPKSSKSSSRSKAKKKIKDSVEKAKASELGVVSSGGINDGEPEVLDLADQLLDQIENNTSASSVSAPPSTIQSTSHLAPAPSARSGSSIESSSSSGFRQGIKDAITKGRNRQQARKERKEAEVLKKKEQAEQEARDAPDDGAEEERIRLDNLCRKHHWQIFEVEPDGHCLFNAVADQLNFWRISAEATYATTRQAAASFMLEHPDDFLPYLPATEIDPASPDGVLSMSKYKEYCTCMGNSAIWGGQVEIMALSRYYNVPIHVIQADGPEVQVGESESTKTKHGTPLRISYHKKMYGLGEHYNSVRPAQPPPSMVFFSGGV